MLLGSYVGFAMYYVMCTMFGWVIFPVVFYCQVKYHGVESSLKATIITCLDILYKFLYFVLLFGRELKGWLGVKEVCDLMSGGERGEE